jgi:quercetin dioxygenase-like cupin family protein
MEQLPMSEEVKIVRNGEAEELHVLGVNLSFLCRPEDTGNAWSLMENVIPRDAGPPPHYHAWAEAYYLISGEVEFDIAGERTAVRAGDFIYAPAGTVHAFRGVSEEAARMLVIDAPAHAEAFFKQVDRDVSDPVRDGHKIPGIGAANGIHFVPQEMTAS